MSNIGIFYNMVETIMAIQQARHQHRGHDCKLEGKVYGCFTDVSSSNVG
jgi:hypothetical protein